MWVNDEAPGTGTSGNHLVCFDILCGSRDNNKDQIILYFHGKKKSSTEHHRIVCSPPLRLKSPILAEFLKELTGTDLPYNDPVFLGITYQDLLDICVSHQIVAHVWQALPGQPGLTQITKFVANPNEDLHIRNMHDRNKKCIIPIKIRPDYQWESPKPKKDFSVFIAEKRAALAKKSQTPKE